MKNYPIKIQAGNDVALQLRPRFHRGDAVNVSLLTDIVISFGVNEHFEVVSHTVKASCIEIPIAPTTPAGVYDLRFQAKLLGRVVQDTRIGYFEIVPNGEGIDYCRYTGDLTIVGYSDAELDRLKAEYRDLIAEAEEAKEEWLRKVEMLDDVAKQGDNPEATNSAIYDLIYHGGGGGGGGLTPEQWDKIAKEQTLNEIKGMLTLADGEVTTELQTLIPNEEETV